MCICVCDRHTHTAIRKPYYNVYPAVCQTINLLKNKKCFSRIENMRNSQKTNTFTFVKSVELWNPECKALVGGQFLTNGGPEENQSHNQKIQKSGMSLGEVIRVVLGPLPSPSLLVSYDFYTQNKGQRRAFTRNSLGLVGRIQHFHCCGMASISSWGGEILQDPPPCGQKKKIKSI